MRRSLLTVGFVGLAAFATGTSACNQILGSFDPGSGGATSSATDTAATSTAIGSGGSSGVGGGMGEPRFDYACSFALAEPRVLTQISAAGGAYIDRLLVAERGNSGSPRVLVHVANATTGDLTAINADAPDQSFSAKNVLEVLDIKRLSATATGILAMVGGVGGFSLALLELPDGKDQFIERILLPPANLPVDKSNPNFSGAFVSLKPNEANWSVDVVVAFKTTTGVYNARYGNFTVMGGKTVSFIDPMNPLAQGGVRVFTAFRSQSKDRTFAYLAPNQEGAATFEFALDPAVTGAVPPRDYGGGLVLAAVERPTGFNIATIAFQTTKFDFVLGQLPLERLGLFKAKELPVHGTFDFQSDVLPLGNPAFGWFGDTFAFIGAQTDNAKGGKDDIGYRFIDTDAQVRGAGKLPMKLPEAASGFTHRTINEVAAAIRGGVLAGADGKFHVAWTDVQEDASFNTVTLIGYEELACTGTPAR